MKTILPYTDIKASAKPKKQNLVAILTTVGFNFNV